jgi:hypothetical protein
MWFLALFPIYFVWHYTQAIKDYWFVSRNLIWFVYNFFSIDILLKTLFSPWRRLGKDDTSEKPSFLTNLIINVLMRISGFIIRVFSLILGMASFVSISVVVFLGFFRLDHFAFSGNNFFIVRDIKFY